MSRAKIDPREIEANAIEMIESRWMLVTAGDMNDFNMMTANWGALGELWFKHVAFVFIRPQRHTFKFAEQHDVMTLSFFGEEHRAALQFCGRYSGRDKDKIAETGLTPYKTELGGVAFEEAEIVLECRKMYVDDIKEDNFHNQSIIENVYPKRDFHRLYVVEIVNAWMKSEK